MHALFYKEVRPETFRTLFQFNNKHTVVYKNSDESCKAVVRIIKKRWFTYLDNKYGFIRLSYHLFTSDLKYWLKGCVDEEKNVLNMLIVFYHICVHWHSFLAKIHLEACSFFFYFISNKHSPIDTCITLSWVIWTLKEFKN